MTEPTHAYDDEVHERVEFLIESIGDWVALARPDQARAVLRRELAQVYSDGYFQHAANMDIEGMAYRNPYRQLPPEPADDSAGSAE